MRKHKTRKTRDKKSNSKRAGKKKRDTYAKRACIPCRRSKVGCDNSRPCEKCCSRGIADKCRDEPDLSKDKPYIQNKSKLINVKTEAKESIDSVSLNSTPNIIDDKVSMLSILQNIEPEKVMHNNTYHPLNDATTSINMNTNNLLSNVVMDSTHHNHNAVNQHFTLPLQTKANDSILIHSELHTNNPSTYISNQDQSVFHVNDEIKSSDVPAADEPMFASISFDFNQNYKPFDPDMMLLDEPLALSSPTPPPQVVMLPDNEETFNNDSMKIDHKEVMSNKINSNEKNNDNHNQMNNQTNAKQNYNSSDQINVNSNNKSLDNENEMIDYCIETDTQDSDSALHIAYQNASQVVQLRPLDTLISTEYPTSIVTNSSEIHQIVNQVNVSSGYKHQLNVLMANFVADCAATANTNLKSIDAQKFLQLLEQFCGFYAGFRVASGGHKLSAYASRWLGHHLYRIKRWVGGDKAYSVRNVTSFMENNHCVSKLDDRNFTQMIEDLGSQYCTELFLVREYLENLPFPAVQYVLNPTPLSYPAWANNIFLTHMNYTQSEFESISLDGRTSLQFLTLESRQKSYVNFPRAIESGANEMQFELELISRNGTTTKCHQTFYISYIEGTMTPLYLAAVYIPSSLGTEVINMSFRAISEDLSSTLRKSQTRLKYAHSLPLS